MSFEVLLSQSKILAYFTLDISANVQQKEVLQPTTYPCIIFHNHYPVVYFQELYQHFQYCLPSGTKPGNLRLYIGDKQLPAQLPIGLFLKESTVNLTVRVQLSVCLLDAFKLVKNSWKKAFQVVNPNQKCDYIKSQLSKREQQQKYKLYKSGLSHGLQKQGKYEGAFIIIKGLYQDTIIQRKYSVTQFPTMLEIVKQLFCLSEEQIKNQNIKILSFNLPIDLQMSSKIFLDQWSYNDGYCYLKLQLNNLSQ